LIPGIVLVAFDANQLAVFDVELLSATAVTTGTS
jgi:hypothetical protein